MLLTRDSGRQYEKAVDVCRLLIHSVSALVPETAKGPHAKKANGTDRQADLLGADVDAKATAWLHAQCSAVRNKARTRQDSFVMLDTSCAWDPSSMPLRNHTRIAQHKGLLHVVNYSCVGWCWSNQSQMAGQDGAGKGVSLLQAGITTPSTSWHTAVIPRSLHFAALHCPASDPEPLCDIKT
jgi:hypothetical protein